jgi:hypothetical protein
MATMGDTIVALDDRDEVEQTVRALLVDCAQPEAYARCQVR